MGCGQKAAAERDEDIRDAIKKVGLNGDKIWDIGNKPMWLEDAFIACAREGLTTEQTIYALHAEKHRVLANKKAREEVEARKLLKQLQERF